MTFSGEIEMIKVLNVDKKNEWDKSVKAIPSYDVFYLSDYLDAFQAIGAGEPLLVIYSNGTDYAVNAIFKRDISVDKHFNGKIENNKYFDIITPYGYGWFIGVVTDKTKLMQEWQNFCRDNGFISEFVRFNLFTDYKDYYPGTVETNTHNVVRTLQEPLESIWTDFKPKVRKNVKRANANGLQIVLDNEGSRLDDFLRIYYGTMERTKANNEFFFPKSFFETLMHMKDNVMFFHVMYEEKVISTELVIYGAENCYSYLGGTDSEYFELRPNDFLKYEIIKWAKEKGLQNFVLGGGYGTDDGIFQYKASFAPHGIKEYYIGKSIFNENSYLKLCDIRKIEYCDDVLTTGYFPRYRIV